VRFQRRTQIQALSSSTDNRRVRSDNTKNAIMRAAERLIADRGIENVSIRDIVSAAGQKNESALQYHFKNLTGLIEEIKLARSDQTHLKRAELIQALHQTTTQPSVADACKLMVQPAFELACEDKDFHCYVKAFGHELVLTNSSPSAKATAQGGGGASGKQTAAMLKDALPHLDAEIYQQRLDAAVLLSSASMYHQARQKNAFIGDQAQLFLHSLVDALVGVFTAPVSPETQVLTDKAKSNS